MVRFIQYYDPFFHDWFVVRDRAPFEILVNWCRILEDCDVYRHCSIYEVA